MADEAHTMSAGLYVVATPIGNLGDITARAIAVLRGADIIAAEDTRRTGILLNHLQIPTRPIAFHAHNEGEKQQQMVDQIRDGKCVALVSDAGTPLIADPGYGLVRAVREAGLAVIPIPGPSSMVAAISAAGLPTHRFTFEGFVPAKEKARQSFYQRLALSDCTTICFEAPHRLRASLEALTACMDAEREVVICRELTKTFEQIAAGSASQLLAQLTAGEIPEKGEIVLVIAGQASTAGLKQVDDLLLALLDELSPSKAAAVVSRVTGTPKREVYERALSINRD